MKERDGVVYVTAEEMRKIDETTIQDFGIDVLVLMENAGKATATLGIRMLEGKTGGKRVGCLAGAGNNGGDAMVAARHLANWGLKVDVIMGTGKDRMKDVPLGQYHILEKMGLRTVFDSYNLREYDLLIDGLIGYGLEGNPRNRMAGMIRDANESDRPILAVDLPSGMNATSGGTYDPCIRAAATLTLALPKTCFLAPGLGSFVGDLYLADISIPRKIYEQFGQESNLFERDTLRKI